MRNNDAAQCDAFYAVLQDEPLSDLQIAPERHNQNVCSLLPCTNSQKGALRLRTYVPNDSNHEIGFNITEKTVMVFGSRSKYSLSSAPITFFALKYEVCNLFSPMIDH